MRSLGCGDKYFRRRLPLDQILAALLLRLRSEMDSIWSIIRTHSGNLVLLKNYRKLPAGTSRPESATGGGSLEILAMAAGDDEMAVALCWPVTK